MEVILAKDVCKRCQHTELQHDCIDNEDGHFPVGCLVCNCSYFERAEG